MMGVSLRFMENLKNILRRSLGPAYNPLKELYYWLIYISFKAFKKRTGTLVYIGLNNGGSFKKIYFKYETIIGFEPNPYNFNKLQKYNQIKGVTLYPYAVSDKDGHAFLHLPSNENNSASASLSDFTEVRDGIRTIEKIKVKTVSLMSILQKHEIKTIESYVSDIEGYDFEVLNSVKTLIEDKSIRSIQVEACQNHAPNPYVSISNYEYEFDKLLSKNYEKTARGWGILLKGVFQADRADSFSIDLLYELK
jgi:FkbM family methyltransferase